MQEFAEQQYRDLIDQLPAVLWTTDLELRFTSSSGMGLKELNLKKNEVVGMTLPEFVAQDPNSHLPIKAHRDALNGESSQYEMEFRDRVYNVYIAPIRDGNAHIVGTIGIAVDLTEQKQTEHKLRQSEKQLQALSDRLISLQEQERQRIAQTIHDELGQLLTVSIINAASIEKELPAGSKLIERVTRLRQTVEEAMKSVRHLSADLKPRIMDELDIESAIEWQVNNFTKNTGIVCEYRKDSTTIDLGRERAVSLYRVLQETLTNVARHTRASFVKVSLTSHRQALRLVFQDNGQGITEKQINNPNSLGLTGIRERVRFLHGKLEIFGESGVGTTVKVDFPMRPEGGA